MASDSLVIGAGPSGLLAAKQIASKGFSVKILEEHNQIGVPSHCAGLISIEGLSRIGVGASEDFVQNKIFGGRIYSPDEQCIEIRDKRPRAYVVDRAAFDQYLGQITQDAGAEILLNKRVEKLALSKGHVIGAFSQGEAIDSRLLIDAEGPSRRLAKKAGLIKNKHTPLLGVNTEIESEIDPEIVEVWFGEETAPGFFAWVIPCTEKKVRIGLATKRGDPTKLLARFIKKRFKTTSHPPPSAGQVLIDGPVQQTAFPGAILVGDTAGHVKPTTGGGIVIGGLCAIEAGRVAVKAVETNDFSQRSLEQYEETWRRLYGSQFRSMQIIRNLAGKISDSRMNRLFHTYSESSLGDIVNDLLANGDMDLQEGVIRRALSEPHILKVALSGFGRLILSELHDLVNL